MPTSWGIAVKVPAAATTGNVVVSVGGSNSNGVAVMMNHIWPETIVFGQSGVSSENGWKIRLWQGQIA